MSVHRRYLIQFSYIAFVCSADDLVSDRPQALALMLADVKRGDIIIIFRRLHSEQESAE